MGREIRGQVKPVTRLEAGPIRPYLLSGPTGPGQTQEQNKSKITKKLVGHSGEVEEKKRRAKQQEIQ